ncbi:MAG: DUF1836 domain-containing protein [Oscillospiraceae bacterium]|nr:DUF1836 domain-containing protein [Oscillospiraceae bacterium]
MTEKVVPGTTIPYADSNGMFAMFRPLIRATDGLTLGQVCAITGLEVSTIQNWVKRKFVPRPVEKKYHERQLARILLISALRDGMKIDAIGELMTMVNGDADDVSDDIISEEQLYDYLCHAMADIDDRPPSAEEVPALVERITADYAPPDEAASRRLRSALTVMILAHTAGRYKQQAEKWFEQLKEDQNG